ncbi:MAG: ABC transporter permease, partial [Anaerolineaceae bacterium]|nr:ABC transporter permease [Anaerolineaceae bacterium]
AEGSSTLSSLWMLAWRNLSQARTLTFLSVLSVALGAAMTIAADVISSAMMNAFIESGDALTFLKGLLDELDRALGMIGVGISIAAGFVIYNAFAMTVNQRRRQIGALRSLGMTRLQVMKVVLLEALVIGILGTVLGLVTGPLLGVGTIGLMKMIFGEGLFVFAASSPSTTSILTASLSGIFVTMLSVLLPARSAARISPLQALRPEYAQGIQGHPVRYGIVGGLGIVILVTWLAISPPGEWVEPPWDFVLTGLVSMIWLTCLASFLPLVINVVGKRCRKALRRIFGASGQLAADNLRRGHRRVPLTILALALALTMIVSMTGVMEFFVNELMLSKISALSGTGIWMLSPFDISLGMSAYNKLETVALSTQALDELREAYSDQLQVVEVKFVIVPELSFFGASYFSFVVNPHEVSSFGDPFFSFIEGDWETALEIMESGCGVLITPLVASKNNVAVGEGFLVTSQDGPVECTVAGIGSSLVNASIISDSVGNVFGVLKPMSAVVMANPGTDIQALERDLSASLNRFPEVYLARIETMTELQVEMMDKLPYVFDALLLLAILAAAIGIVNATMMNVAERRREIGLLHAVGASRQQIQTIVVGEAALIGLIGGVLGLVAGSGVTIIIATVYGGNAWGYPQLDLWAAAWRSVQPAMFSGLVGVIAAPMISALAASFPIRSILQNSVVEILEPAHQE